jgi:anti-anti-sigma factor
LEISTSVHNGDIIVLEVKGEVDAHTVRFLDKLLEDLFTQEEPCVVIDLSAITFISSAGLRTILYAHKEAVKSGGEVRLTVPAGPIRRMFEITGFPEVMKIFDTLPECLSQW